MKMSLLLLAATIGVAAAIVGSNQGCCRVD